MSSSRTRPFHDVWPLLIMERRWIRPGKVASCAEVVDVAPTLADILRVCRPAAAEGRR
jgi:hypothetical protein